MSFYALAAEATQAASYSGSGYPNHWVIGGVCLGILIIAMIILVIFGKGREHT